MTKQETDEEQAIFSRWIEFYSFFYFPALLEYSYVYSRY